MSEKSGNKSTQQEAQTEQNKGNTNSINAKLNNIKDIVARNSSGISFFYIFIFILMLLLLSGAGFGIQRTVVYFRKKNENTQNKENNQPDINININNPNENTPNDVLEETSNDISSINNDLNNTISNNNISNLRDMNPEDYLKHIMETQITNSANYVDNKFGDFNQLYFKLLQQETNKMNNKNDSLKVDMSNMLSLREQNHRRQVFLEVLLFNLVQKHKELLEQVDQHNTKEADNSDKLKQVLYVNQLLQNKINKLMGEKKNLEREKDIIKNIGKTFKFMKVGPKMYKELKNLNLDKNLPEKVRENIKNKGMVHVIKV
jgi:hypothetical protein